MNKMIGDKIKIGGRDGLCAEIPHGWHLEQHGHHVSLDDGTHDGAMTISFYAVLSDILFPEAYLKEMAEDFAAQNRIFLQSPLIFDRSDPEKTVLQGTGFTAGHRFSKIWIAAKFPKIVFATYQCRRKQAEVVRHDGVIGSIRFL